MVAPATRKTQWIKVAKMGEEFGVGNWSWFLVLVTHALRGLDTLCLLWVPGFPPAPRAFRRYTQRKKTCLMEPSISASQWMPKIRPCLLKFISWMTSLNVPVLRLGCCFLFFLVISNDQHLPRCLTSYQILWFSLELFSFLLLFSVCNSIIPNKFHY